MVLTEAISAELRSRESSGILQPSSALILATLTRALAALHSAVALPNHPRILSHSVEGSFQVIAFDTASAAEHSLPIRPKTRLGQRLNELRNKAIAKGMPLLDSDEILIEVQKRRGELN